MSDIKDLKIDEYIMDYDDINYCIGCFSCWTKSPLKCIFKDKCFNKSKLLIDADELIIISKCIYGSFSYKVKKILERNISFVYPYFEIRNSEIHHKMRTDNKLKVKILFYGNIKKEISKELVHRNSLNFNYDSYSIFYLKNEDEVRSKINGIIY